MLRGPVCDPIPSRKPITTPTKKHHRDYGLHKRAIENSHKNFHKKIQSFTLKSFASISTRVFLRARS